MTNTDNEAMAKAACNAIFSTQGEVESMCARYAYNMGYYFMNGQVKSPFVGVGNMGTDAYYAGVQNLGYRLEINENGLTKDEVKYKIKNSTFPPGSIVCYRCNTTSPGASGASSHYKYGHTQFYIGGDRTDGSSFPSSVRKNYGSAFVYSHRPGDSWQYKVFVPSGSSSLLYCEQEYVPNVEWPVGHQKLPDGSINYKSSAEFYTSLYVEQSSSEQQSRCRQIVNKLMSECGLSKKAACAFAGVMWQESQLNPSVWSKNTKIWDYGLAQWTTPYGRQQALWLFCGSNKTDFANFNKQLDFVIYELKNVYKSPTTGNAFDYTPVIPSLKILDNKGASMKELCWCIVSKYEMGGKYKNLPFDQSYWDSNALHIKNRTQYAEQALNIVG